MSHGKRKEKVKEGRNGDSLIDGPSINRQDKEMCMIRYRTRSTIFFLSGGGQIGPGVFENEPPLSIFPFKIGKNREGRPILSPPDKKKLSTVFLVVGSMV